MDIVVSEVTFFCGAAWKELNIEIIASAKEQLISKLKEEMRFCIINKTLSNDMYKNFLSDYDKSDWKTTHEEFFLNNLDKYMDIDIINDKLKLPIVKVNNYV